MTAIRKSTVARPLGVERRPMAKAARVTLFEREVRERLSEAALEILLGSAQVLAEGEHVPGLRGGATFYGSVMLTVELGGAAGRVREPCDGAAARRVATMMETDPRVGRRLREVAEREATRLTGIRFTSLSTEVRVRTQGTSIFIDVDVEGAA